MSYGLVIRNADGSVAIDDLSRPPRLIFHEQFAWDFSGTRHVPAFDDAKGFISISFGFHKFRGYPHFDNADISAPLDYQQPDTVGVALDTTSMPTVNWDNGTKLLTIAPAGFNDTLVHGQSPFAIFLVMFR